VFESVVRGGAVRSLRNIVNQTRASKEYREIERRISLILSEIPGKNKAGDPKGTTQRKKKENREKVK
jgi:hypothetical protein